MDFPILDRQAPDKCIDSDWLNEEWAMINHGQTLDELASRGGLSYQELTMNIKRIKGSNVRDISVESAREFIRAKLK